MRLLDVRDLHIDFATEKGLLHAVRGVDFSLEEGEVLGIVGESGSGKSVTAHSTMRLLPPNAQYAGGDVLYRGESVFGYGYERLRGFRGREIGVIFQEPGRSFDPIYSIGKTMAETIRAHEPELTDEEIHEKSIRLLQETNVPFPEDRLSNFPHQFSGGLLQRIMIALALASDPKVLIAAHPTRGVDVGAQAVIWDILRDARADGLGTILVSADLEELIGLSDRLLVMLRGKVVAEVDPKTVTPAELGSYMTGAKTGTH